MTAGPNPSLKSELRTLIAENGPVTVERFMALALGHPRFGYYRTRDPLGAAGDFTTAPEISQMFGELIGVWAAAVWNAMGCPDPVRLIELGPGRGTLMADALRAARAWPTLRAALDVHLVETSPVLREAQRAALDRAGSAIAWHDAIETLPDGAAVVIANEFFDALPVRHFLRTPAGWCERLVGLVDGELAFGVAAAPEASLGLAAPPGTILEVGVAGRGIAAALAGRVASQGGAVLVVDYGYAAPRFGESLQAVKAHRFVDPLAEPGEADLTAHVDFAGLAAAARGAGAGVHGPVSQGTFLKRLGIVERAERLKRGADPDRAEAVDAAVARLAGPHAAHRPGMGDLFKAVAFAQPGLALPGFEPEFVP